MTTILYNHKEKEIGIDSRCTIGSYIESDKSVKMRENNNVKFFICGNVSDIEMIVNCYPNKINKKTDAHGFIIINNIVKYIYTDEFDICEVNQLTSLAVGSGSSFAISALDFGKTTKESIKYAFTRDNCSGGKIIIHKVK